MPPNSAPCQLLPDYLPGLDSGDGAELLPGFPVHDNVTVAEVVPLWEQECESPTFLAVFEGLIMYQNFTSQEFAYGYSYGPTGAGMGNGFNWQATCHGTGGQGLLNATALPPYNGSGCEYSADWTFNFTLGQTPFATAPQLANYGPPTCAGCMEQSSPVASVGYLILLLTLGTVVGVVIVTLLGRRRHPPIEETTHHLDDGSDRTLDWIGASRSDGVDPPASRDD
ncbi:MAG: hypothetical protein L3K02_08810 [Thermoplasmata archaeon]|nr:hypothetical protein [Thermoplasmata archaeon]